MKSKILLIVEGQKDEPNILGSTTHGLLSLIKADEYEIIPFSNPIYELYEAYKNGEYDDTVAFLRAYKGLSLSNGMLSKNAFSAVYLIFDFDPHYQKYSEQTIREMLQVFNNETGLGKLYINYPMVEAYYHLCALPDPDFYCRTVNIDGLSGKIYKKHVNNCTCLKKNKISDYELAEIIYHNLTKAKMILESDSDEIDYSEILERQIIMIHSKRCFHVLSTMPLLVFDYNPERTLNMIDKEIKEKRRLN